MEARSSVIGLRTIEDRAPEAPSREAVSRKPEAAGGSPLPPASTSESVESGDVQPDFPRTATPAFTPYAALNADLASLSELAHPDRIDSFADGTVKSIDRCPERTS